MSDRYLATEKQLLLNGIGTELCWGWSPAVNLLQFLPPPQSPQPEGVEVAEAPPSPPPPPASEATRAPLARTRSEELLDALVAETRAERQRDDETATAAATGATITGASAAAGENADDVVEEVNVLLCGAADFRHVLLTMSKMRATAEQRGVAQRLHFYFYEPNLRVHCRHLFFLQLLHDSMFALSELEDRVAMLLELYGNTKLRDITAAQAKDVAQRLLRTVGREEGEFARFVDLSEMKARERDFVEEQLRHWATDASKCLIETQWNSRLRREMADRYDNKDNIIDWDFNFKLFEYTNAVKFPEYRDWRNTGIAYDYCHINPRKGFSYDYEVPNKTLCHFDRRGLGTYQGDVKNGPFASFGIATENAQLHRRNPDGALKFGNGVIAMHNVRAWLYELLTGREWPWADHAFAWDDAAKYNYLPPGTPTDVAYRAAMPDVKFHFVELDLSRFLTRNSERAEPVLFDCAFVGANSTQLMTPQLFASMDPTGVVVCEGIKFVVDAEEEAKLAFQTKIRELGAAAGWEHDARATAALHASVPPPRKYEIELSAAQKKTQARLQMPHQLVLRHRTSAAAVAAAAAAAPAI